MKNTLLIFGLLCTAGLWFLFQSHQSTAKYVIMSYEEYANIEHDVPYIFQLSKSDQCFYYFGANHSCDPANEQYPKLDKFWHEFLEQTQGKNCVVLVEGRLPKIVSNKQEAIMTGAESRYVAFLAHQANVFVACPEPNDEFIISELLRFFSQEEIVYKIFAQYVLEFHRHFNVNKDLSFDEYIQKAFKQEQPLFSIVLTMNLMKKLNQEFFKIPLDIYNEQFFKKIAKPIYPDTYDEDTFVNKICRTENNLRDQHIVDCIGKLIKQGKNIFIVFGASHAVMQKQAIREIWNQGQ